MKTKINKFSDLEKISLRVRREVIEMLYKNKSHHVGCSLGIVDLLVALYFSFLKIYPKNKKDENRDRFLLSKGHGVSALYAVLLEKNFLTTKEINGFSKNGGILCQHPIRDLNFGIEFSSGSLGYGLAVANGLALAAKKDNKKYRTVVLLGDGELQEGLIWESAMFASHFCLDNLVAIVDYNKMQYSGLIKDVLGIEPLKEKWQAFGWAVKEVNSHSFKDLTGALNSIPFEKGRPSVIIGNTVKGKGVSFMENDPRWHSRIITDEEYRKAILELKEN